MKVIKFILAISVIALSTFSLINDSFDLHWITSFLVGVLLLMMGAEAIKKEEKTLGYLSIAAALLNLFVALKALLYSLG